MKPSFFLSRAPRWRRSLLGASLLLATGASATLISGCSGGAGTKNGYYNQNTGFYVAADQKVGNGIGHTFLELKNGIPVRQGMELTTAALSGFSTTDVSLAYLGTMPSVTNGSQFTNVVLTSIPSFSQFQPAQFQMAMLIRPALVTGEPYTAERQAVAKREVSEGFIRLVNTDNPKGVVVPGGGVVYDDPNAPAGQPPQSIQGQQFLYYEGHMNGILIGPSLEQLTSNISLTRSIPQPPFYPRDGYYPTTWGIRYDATRDLHILEFSNFVRASQFVAPGT